MNIEKRRRQQCFQSGCKYAENRCIVFHGKDCMKLGGKKIPVQRIPTEETLPNKRPGFKPYFLSPLEGVEL